MFARINVVCFYIHPFACPEMVGGGGLYSLAPLLHALLINSALCFIKSHYRWCMCIPLVANFHIVNWKPNFNYIYSYLYKAKVVVTDFLWQLKSYMLMNCMHV